MSKTNPLEAGPDTLLEVKRYLLEDPIDLSDESIELLDFLSDPETDDSLMKEWLGRITTLGMHKPSHRTPQDILYGD